MGTEAERATILIVDDDASNRDRIAQWFRDAAWQVWIADGCEEAIETARSSSPTVVIVEQRLEDGSGLDLLPRLSEICGDLNAAVVLTRYPSVAAAVRAIRLGFRDYLPKPVQRGTLARMFELPAVEARPGGDVGSGDGPTSLARIEWEHIHAALFECEGNVSEAARRLRIPRRSLQRKLRRVAPR